VYLKKKRLKINIKYIAAFLISLCLIIFISISAVEYTTSKSKDIDDCLACHEDSELQMESGTKQISVFVNPELYKKSVHGSAECSDCHLNYNPDEIPHSKNSKAVECSTCHDDLKGIEHSVHAKTECVDCHGKHDIMPVKETQAESSANCLSCHKKKSITQFSSSIHSKKGVKCNDCHGDGHQVKKISRNQITDLCGKCHNDSKMNFKGSIHHSAIKDGNKNKNTPVCTDCHGSHKIVTSKFKIESEACMKCHLDEKLFPGEETGSAKFVAQYKTSVHASIGKGGMESAGCTDCHGDHMIQSPDDPKSSTKRAQLVETCGKCHADVVANFKKSKHGKELINNNKDAPTCSDCHGEHNIQATLLSDEFSKLNIANKCISCHEKSKLAEKTKEGNDEMVIDFKNSVHYKALLKGDMSSATCSDCHGAHEMDKPDDPHSRVNRNNIVSTCGQSNCHSSELAEYSGSVHDISQSEKENPNVPTCNTCHGNHIILKADEKENKLSYSKGIVQTCSDCHDSRVINEKYDIKTKQVETFKESIHGIYIQFGDEKAANCASCHGTHNIRREDDPQSSIHQSNISKTCGQTDCHPNASVNFVKGKIHLDPKSKDSGFIYYVSTFFKYFTFTILFSLFLYIVLDLRSKIRERKRPKSENNDE